MDGALVLATGQHGSAGDDTAHMADNNKRGKQQSAAREETYRRRAGFVIIANEVEGTMMVEAKRRASENDGWFLQVETVSWRSRCMRKAAEASSRKMRSWHSAPWSLARMATDSVSQSELTEAMSRRTLALSAS